MRVLTWNLFHGRSLPAGGVDLAARFAGMLAEWEWDVALLQETPPWWPALLARATGAERRVALTSRNAGARVRRALGERWPDLIKSNAGGCNAILVRLPDQEPSTPVVERSLERSLERSHQPPVGPQAPVQREHSRHAIQEHRSVRLRTWPERRVGQLARLADGMCVVNFHASARVGLAETELEQLWEHALRFAGGAPLILGGDLNLRAPHAPDASFLHAARRDVDHLFVRGLEPDGPADRLDRWVSLCGRCVQLSDHVPLLLTLSER
jgi:endonuclease/exonuclease/phosphatase family metal-dependent hydrolase